MKKYNIALVGATGLVGRTITKVLEERKFPLENIYFFASKRSSGTKVQFNGMEYLVEELTEHSFDRPIDLALFSAGGAISEKYAPIAKAKGVIVIDNSSHFRLDKDVPLIVPEVNPNDIEKHHRIIANPNCSTIQSVVPLGVLDKKYQIKRIIFSTYQAVSGSGVKGLRDLELGLKGEKVENYPHQIAFNCLPHIDVFLDNGYTKEEMKMIWETRKILHNNNLPITATTVRVPVKHGHSVSMNLEFVKPFELSEVRELLSNYEGIKVIDDVNQNIYPMPITVEGTDFVYVGRIRRDESIANGLNLWVVADNIRKGAATNAVQIAELLIRREII